MLRTLIRALWPIFLLLATLPARAAETAAPPCRGPVAICFAAWGPGKAVLKPLRVGRIYGWRKLDATHGILWLGVEEPYLAVLEPRCPGLGEPVRLDASHAHRLSPAKDKLVYRGVACRIEELYELDTSRVARPGEGLLDLPSLAPPAAASSPVSAPVLPVPVAPAN